MKLNSLLIVFALWHTITIQAHDWTYHIKSNENRDYYMWMPYVQNIKGILYSTKPNYIIGILGDTAIRRVCKEEQIAIVAGYVDSYDVSTAWPQIKNGLAKLASQSGFPEIQYAPICIHGHSAEGLKAIRLAALAPERYYGVIMQGAIVNDDDMTTLNTRIKNIPLLSIRGSEERRVNHVADFPWDATKTGILWMRDSAEKANLIIQPGAGHFIWSKFHSQYTAKWLKESIKTMIPEGVYATNAPITLNTPSDQTGWLIECPDTINLNTLNAMTPLSYSDYENTGKDPTKALWHFNEAMADYWIDIHKTEELKTPVSIKYDDPSLCYNNAWCKTDYISDYTTEMDISATSTPTGLDIKYTSVYNVFDISGTTLRPSPCKHEMYGGYDWVLAVFNGNETYRVAEQAHKIKITTAPPKETFSFSEIADQNADAFPLEIGATYNGYDAQSTILTGAVTAENDTLNVAPFYLGTSTAKICYSYNQYRMVDLDTFNINWISGIWDDPQDITTSIKYDNKKKEIKILPVPADDFIEIRIKNLSSNYYVQVYSLNGVLKYTSEQIKTDLCRINTKKFVAGMYVLVVFTNELKYISQKIVIQ